LSNVLSGIFLSNSQFLVYAINVDLVGFNCLIIVLFTALVFNVNELLFNLKLVVNVTEPLLINLLFNLSFIETSPEGV